MQVTFTHNDAKKDGTLMVGQSIFGDLYDSIATTKKNLSAKYNIPAEHIDISFGPTHGKWQGECAVDKCACANGIGSLGAQCPEHGALKCSNCSVGYHLRDGVCELDSLHSTGKTAMGL